MKIKSVLKASECKPKANKTSLMRLKHLRQYYGCGSIVAVIAFYMLSMLFVRQMALQSLDYAQTDPLMGLGYPTAQLAEVKENYFSSPDSSGLLLANLSELILEQEHADQPIVEGAPQHYHKGNISAYYLVQRGSRLPDSDQSLWLTYVDTSFVDRIVTISTIVVATVAFVGWLLISRACKEAQSAITFEREVARNTFARASHELKTPLAVIQGCADGAADGLLGAQEAHDAITAEIVHATALANQALQCAMAEEGTVAPSIKEVSLADLMEAVKSDSALQNVKIDLTSLSPDAAQDPKVLCDPDFTEALLRALMEEAAFRALPVAVIAQVHETDVSLLLAIQGEVPSQDGLGLGVDFARCLMELQGGSLEYFAEQGETLITLRFNCCKS